jgi:hypothetical protein
LKIVRLENEVVFKHPEQALEIIIVNSKERWRLLMSSSYKKFRLPVAGAIALAFSLYNFQIIEAGHSNKALAIAFFHHFHPSPLEKVSIAPKHTVNSKQVYSIPVHVDAPYCSTILGELP